MRPTSPVLPSHPEMTETLIGAGQPEYMPLPAIRFQDDRGTVLTRWQLTWRERLRVLLTGSVYVESWTFFSKFHPIRLDVREPELIEADIIDPDYGPPAHGRELSQ